MCHESSKKIVDELGTDVFNVKRKRLFKCITFQGKLHLSLSNSAIAISNHLPFNYSKIHYGLHGDEHIKLRSK